MLHINFDPFPILTTQRLVLRPLELSDAEDIFIHRSDDIVNTYLEDFRHADMDATIAFIERVQNEIREGRTVLWVLTERGKNKFMGTVCFWNINKDSCIAETGYTLASEYHRMGYMNEALERAIKYGFEEINLKSIEAYTHEENEGSIKLLLRNNFKPGTPKKEVSSNRLFFSLDRTFHP